MSSTTSSTRAKALQPGLWEKKSPATQPGSFCVNASTKSAPLAERMRPRELAEILGQAHIVGPDSPFGKILRTEGASIPSVVLCGPPGTGKTTIARVIAAQSNYYFVRLSGVLDGVKELREAVSKAEQNFATEGRKTLALVDEIHRFNKSQQDAFLPHLESGLLTVIAQTTENVSFRLRNALLSRMQVLELVPVDDASIESLLERAVADLDRGLGQWNLVLEKEAQTFLVQQAGGDVRRALTALEWAGTVAHHDGLQSISKQLALDAAGKNTARFDQDGDYHYDNISAFIKSMRGSDPDAALYYLVKALEAGEDPHFLTRRMIIFASEDCGCDPRALEVAINADLALERVGLPEGRIPLAQSAVYLACAAKSNASYQALRKVEQIVRDNPNLEVPKKLRNAPTALMKEQGNSLGYNYPHNFPGAFVAEHYLPKELEGQIFYQPSDRALEAQIASRLNQFRKLVRNS